jgi:glutamate racemase
VARATAKAYLSEFATGSIDTLVLGCTHYPLLRGVIQETVGPRVTLVDSAEETARAARALFERERLLDDAGGMAANAEDHFYVTDSSERFREVGARFLGRPLGRLEQVALQE